jgi:hypothetical protein
MISATLFNSSIGATDPEQTAHQTCFRHRLNGIPHSTLTPTFAAALISAASQIAASIVVFHDEHILKNGRIIFVLERTQD